MVFRCSEHLATAREGGRSRRWGVEEEGGTSRDECEGINSTVLSACWFHYKIRALPSDPIRRPTPRQANCYVSRPLLPEKDQKQFMIAGRPRGLLSSILMLHPHIPVRDFHSACPSLCMSQAKHITRIPMSLTIFTFRMERLPYCEVSTSKSSRAAGRTKTESPLAHSRHTSLAIRQQKSLSVFCVSTTLASTQQSGKPNLPSIGPS
jgi:hypothetical protein